MRRDFVTVRWGVSSEIVGGGVGGGGEATTGCALGARDEEVRRLLYGGGLMFGEDPGIMELQGLEAGCLALSDCNSNVCRISSNPFQSFPIISLTLWSYHHGLTMEEDYAFQRQLS